MTLLVTIVHINWYRFEYHTHSPLHLRVSVYLISLLGYIFVFFSQAVIRSSFSECNAQSRVLADTYV